MPWKRLLLVVFVSWGFLASLHADKLLGRQEPAMDFASFYLAGRAVEKDFYDVRTLKQAARSVKYTGSVFPYIYPPFLAEALSHGPENRSAAARLWNFLLVSGVTASLAAIFFMRKRPPRIEEVTFGVLTALLLTFTDNLRVVGQVNAIVIALIAGAWWCESRGWLFASGALLACATALKVTPVVLLVLPLMKGRWRVAVGVAATLLALFALSVLVHGLEPWKNYLAFSEQTAARGSLSNLNLTSFGSFSIASFFARAGAAAVWAQRIGTAIGVLALGAAVVVGRRAKGEASWSGIALAASVAMTLLSPYVWYHHFLFLLPAAFALALDSLETDRRVTIVLFGLLGFVSINWPIFYGTLGLRGSALGESLPLFGLFGLYALGLWFARHTSSPLIGSPAVAGEGYGS